MLTRLAREEETGTREIEPLPHCSFRSASVSLSRFFRPPFGLTHVGWCMKHSYSSCTAHACEGFIATCRAMMIMPVTTAVRDSGSSEKRRTCMHVCAKQWTSDRSWRSHGHPPHAIRQRVSAQRADEKGVIGAIGKQMQIERETESCNAAKAQSP